MLKELGLFEIAADTQDKYLEIDLSHYASGAHQIADYFFKLNAAGKVEWVVSRFCDHANGKLALQSCKTLARCPMHGWTLDLTRLQYTNVQVEKQQLQFQQQDNKLRIDCQQSYLKVPSRFQAKAPKKISIRFLAHACLVITIDDFSIVTDPWLLGPCFMNGWWHAVVPKADALDILVNADLVYISHNHPDHMHSETLHYLQQKRLHIPIIVPAFTSASAERPLKKYGFTNVTALPFSKIYSIAHTDILISILKSGDFRDDSGLFFMSGDFSGLLTVDAAALNRMKLPKNIDFLATAFAGGASGYPWCFEHYSVEERQEISAKSRRAMVKHVLDYVRTTNPKTYMPYAGYFYEGADRDKFIKRYNQKITPLDLQKQFTTLFPNIDYLDPTVTDTVHFDAKGCVSQRENQLAAPLYHLNQSYINRYLEQEKKNGDHFNLHKIAAYFLASQFRDELIVYLLPTNDEFVSDAQGLKINFSSVSVQVEMKSSHDLLQDYEIASPLRKKIIKVRRYALWQVIENTLPWEELSIGFQCRITRRPDVYNSKFWDYFSNIYISNAEQHEPAIGINVC